MCVMRSTPTPRMITNGTTCRYRLTSGLSKRDEARNRFKPTGGKRNPSSRLARKMTPR
jgi:hypothetical protein